MRLLLLLMLTACAPKIVRPDRPHCDPRFLPVPGRLYECRWVSDGHAEWVKK